MVQSKVRERRGDRDQVGTLFKNDGSLPKGKKMFNSLKPRLPFVLILGTMLILIIQVKFVPLSSAEDGVNVIYSSLSSQNLPAPARTALLDALSSPSNGYEAYDGNTYHLVGLRVENTWAIGTMSFADLSDSSANGYNNVAEIDNMFSILLVMTEKGWKGAVDTDHEIATLLDYIPSSELAEEARSVLFYDRFGQPERAESPAILNSDEQQYHYYKFPWPSVDDFSVSRGFGSSNDTKPHCNGTDIGQKRYQCVDFANNLRTSPDPNIVAAATGVVTLVCDIPNNGIRHSYVVITTSGTNQEMVGYRHINGNTMAIQTGDVVQQGDYIGKLFPRAVSNSCGHVEGMHLHLTMPTNNFVIDGQTFGFGVHPGGTLRSTQGTIVPDTGNDNNPVLNGQFPDVPSGHPFFTYIETLFYIDAISGYSNGNFYPDSEITRGQIAKMIVLALGEQYLEDEIDPPPFPPFPDVPPNHPFYFYVMRMKDLGITQGYSDGTYRPDAPITRGELAAFLTRALNDGEDPEYDDCLIVFDDVPCYHNYYEHTRQLMERFDQVSGETLGFSDGTYRPDINTKRGEASKLVVVSLGMSPMFPDVEYKNPFYKYIQILANRGAIRGYSDGEFKPNIDVDRGQFAKMVVRGLGIAVSASSYPTPTFPDVPKTHPFYAEIEYLARKNIIDGYSDGSFRPDVPISRGQVAKVIVRAVDEVLDVSCGYSQSPPFTDVDSSNQFYTYIQCLWELGITNGYSDHTYRPDANLTRGQSAKFVHLASTQRTPAPLQEPVDIVNNHPDSSVYSGVYYEGTVRTTLPSGDRDFIRMTVPANFRSAGQSQYVLAATNAGSNTDVCIQVYDSQGSLLAHRQGYSSLGNTYLIWEPSEPGTYYLQLTNTKEGAIEGGYTYFNIDSMPTANGLYLPLVTGGTQSALGAGESPSQGPCTISSWPSGPVAPSGLSATNGGTNTVELTWSDRSSNETGFAIYDETGLIGTTTSNTSTYMVNGLPPNTWKCHYVKAYNSGGFSERSNWSCIYTLYDHIDNFSNTNSGWYDDGNIYRYIGGEYQIRPSSQNTEYRVVAPFVGKGGYILEAEARLYSGSPIRYGFVFDMKDWSHYFTFSINPSDQSYALEKRNGTQYTLIAQGYSGGILMNGATNHITVVKVDNSLIAIVLNDSYHLGTFQSGGSFYGDLRAGFYVKSGTGVPVAARFDDLRIRELPSSQNRSTNMQDSQDPLSESSTSQIELLSEAWPR